MNLRVYRGGIHGVVSCDAVLALRHDGAAVAATVRALVGVNDEREVEVARSTVGSIAKSVHHAATC